MNMVCHSIYLSLLSPVSYGFQCTNVSLPKEPFALPCLSHLSQGQEDGLMKRGNVLPPLCSGLQSMGLQKIWTQLGWMSN